MEAGMEVGFGISYQGVSVWCLALEFELLEPVGVVSVPTLFDVKAIQNSIFDTGSSPAGVLRSMLVGSAPGVQARLPHVMIEDHHGPVSLPDLSQSIDEGSHRRSVILGVLPGNIGTQGVEDHQASPLAPLLVEGDIALHPFTLRNQDLTLRTSHDV